MTVIELHFSDAHFDEGSPDENLPSEVEHETIPVRL